MRLYAVRKSATDLYQDFDGKFGPLQDAFFYTSARIADLRADHDFSPLMWNEEWAAFDLTPVKDEDA